jgi:hypothetical protein
MLTVGMLKRNLEGLADNVAVVIDYTGLYGFRPAEGVSIDNLIPEMAGGRVVKFWEDSAYLQCQQAMGNVGDLGEIVKVVLL